VLKIVIDPVPLALVVEAVLGLVEPLHDSMGSSPRLRSGWFLGDA
jgi:hypothetical protein